MKKVLAAFVFVCIAMVMVGSVSSQTVTHIHDVQGSGASSPLDGQTVTVQGVVSQVYSGLYGFYMQEEPSDQDGNALTSEGVFVYGYTNVSACDVVQVSGQVDEYYELTELKNVTVTSFGPGDCPSAQPVVVSNNMERYEGMLVIIPGDMYISDNYNLARYGEVSLVDIPMVMNYTQVNYPSQAGYIQYTNNINARTIVLDDGNAAQNPNPVVYPQPQLSYGNPLRAGSYTTNLEGVLDYRYEQYRIQPLQNVVFTLALRPVQPVLESGIKVASMNLLNFFVTFGNTCGPNGDMDCRGADNQAEYDRQVAKLLSAINAIDADIIAFQELENSQLALNTLDALLTNHSVVNEPWEFLGNDAIRVAIAYNPQAVTPVGSPMTTELPPAYVMNRKPIAQVFRDNETGEHFGVVVVHLKSKGCDGAVGVDADISDGQGCWNNVRAQATSFIANWDIGISEKVILGDFNSYRMESPLQTLEANGYTIHSGEYTYIYDGYRGALDHAAVSESLEAYVVDEGVWHVNADEPRAFDYNTEYNLPQFYNTGAYRYSDHDVSFIVLRFDNTSSCAISQGQVRLNEIWPNPRRITIKYPWPPVQLPRYQAIELKNMTNETVSLDGCVIDVGANQYELTNVVLPVGGYYVFGDYEFLNSNGQQVSLLNGGNVIDSVTYPLLGISHSWCRHVLGWVDLYGNSLGENNTCVPTLW